MTARTGAAGFLNGPMTAPGQPTVGLVLANNSVMLPATVGVAAGGVTVAGSWIPSLWGDEAATTLSATRSLPSLCTKVQHVDAVHAVY